MVLFYCSNTLGDHMPHSALSLIYVAVGAFLHDLEINPHSSSHSVMAFKEEQAVEEKKNKKESKEREEEERA